MLRSKQKMRKYGFVNRGFVLSVLLIFITLMLSACDPVTPERIHLQKDNLESKIKRIELVHYENPDQKRFKSYYKDHFKQLQSYDESNETILKELSAERIPDFLDRLSETDILSGSYDYDSPKCLCLKLVFSDDSYMIMSCKEKSFIGYIGTYSATGEVVDFIGSFGSNKDWADLLNEYFGISKE